MRGSLLLLLGFSLGCNSDAMNGSIAEPVFDDVVDDSLPKQVDILFQMPSSVGQTIVMHSALVGNIPHFIQALQSTGTNFHIGVTTTDIGTFTAPGMPWPISLGSCNTFEGDDGTLQHVACTSRTGTGVEERDQCTRFCPDPGFVPPGRGFIASGDPGPEKMFQCIALVGNGSCSVEGPLEASRRALDGHNPNNFGFLRDGSVLAVVYLATEDDCSVSLAGRKENNPTTVDCPVPDKNADFNCFNPNYRCYARSLECDQPLNTVGTKSNCRERPSYLQPVSTYVRFLQGLRPPSRLLVAGIWPPPMNGPSKLIKMPNDTGHFVVMMASGAMKTDHLDTPSGNMDAACYYTGDMLIGGEPQLRLSHFAAQIPGSIEASSCDLDKYPQVLDGIAKAIQLRLDSPCLSAVPRAALGGAPDCVVGDVDRGDPHGVPAAPFPACSAGCCKAWADATPPTASDTGIKRACAGEASTPCFCAPRSNVEQVCPGGAVAGVWRGGGMIAAHQVTHFHCFK